MKNKLFLLFLCATCCITNAQETDSIATGTNAIERTTHLVFRRYYFISRLEKTISLLQEIINNAQRDIVTRIIRKSKMPIFSHASILESDYRIRQSKSLKPILVVWEDFSVYKSLEAEIVIGKDDLFVKEFSQQLFVIAKSILRETKPTTYKKMLCNDTVIINGSSEEIIDSLDYIVELIQSDSPDVLDNISIPKKTNADIKIHASADEINVRFYLIQRLSPALDLISSIAQKKDLPLRAKEIIPQVSATWSQVKQYRKIGDSEYMRDFCILLFSVLKGLSQNNHSHSDTSLIERLDIEDILYSIDVIADELHMITEEYSKEKKTSFKDWIIKNWWIPVGTVCTISLKIIQHCLDKNKPT